MLRSLDFALRVIGSQWGILNWMLTPEYSLVHRVIDWSSHWCLWILARKKKGYPGGQTMITRSQGPGNMQRSRPPGRWDVGLDWLYPPLGLSFKVKTPAWEHEKKYPSLSEWGKNSDSKEEAITPDTRPDVQRKICLAAHRWRAESQTV